MAPIPELPPQPNCALCGEAVPLRQSHLVPSFVIRELREGCGTGHIRTNDAPNRRAQDARTFALLCDDCEQICGRYEKAFAERIFFPRRTESTATYEYDGWMSRFAAALVWRVVRLYQLLGHLPGPEFAEAEIVWRDFLLGRRGDVGSYELHLLPVDGATSVPALGTVENLRAVPVNINRYMLRSAAIDLLVAERSAFVFVKLPGYVFLGLVRGDGSRLFRGTRLAMRKGRIGPRRYGVPVPLLNYMFDKAEEGARMIASLSPTQRAKIHAAMASDPGRLANSESARAMLLDMDLFGDDAFRPPLEDPKSRAPLVLEPPLV